MNEAEKINVMLLDTDEQVRATRKAVETRLVEELWKTFDAPDRLVRVNEAQFEAAVAVQPDGDPRPARLVSVQFRFGANDAEVGTTVREVITAVAKSLAAALSAKDWEHGKLLVCGPMVDVRAEALDIELFGYLEILHQRGE